mmetsp:Transcript_29742/g.43833  ORF Transcript_29742/g.43833 Transcript_29742/m.43833 type:complete len:105 (-) Transcript_29742:1564-1878(-)
MVILETAAITAAGYGVYRGGKAAVNGTKKKVGEMTERRERKKERQQEVSLREESEQREREKTASMSVNDRLSKYKKESGLKSSYGGLSSSKKQTKEGRFSRFRR